MNIHVIIILKICVFKIIIMFIVHPPKISND